MTAVEWLVLGSTGARLINDWMDRALTEQASDEDLQADLVRIGQTIQALAQDRGRAIREYKERHGMLPQPARPAD